MTYGIFGYDELKVKSKDNSWKIRVNNGSLQVGKGSEGCQEIRQDFDGHFAFDISATNQLHFSYKNNYEQIIYYSFFGERGEVIDFGLEEGEKIIFQRIILTDRINIIVLSRKTEGEGWKISLCYKEDNRWSDPLVIDTGWGSGLEKFALACQNNYLYLFYQIYTDSKYQLVYKKGRDNKWSERNIVSRSEKINISPALIVTHKGNLHFSWLRWEKGIFRVMYSSKEKSNGPWLKVGYGKEVYLSEQKTNCSSPLLINKDGQIDIYWQEERAIKRYNLARKKVENYRDKFTTVNSTSLMVILDKFPQIHPTLLEPAGTSLFFLGEDGSSQWGEIKKNNPVNCTKEEKEKELINSLKEEIEKKEEIINQLEKEIEEKNDLLNSLRKKEADNKKVSKALEDSLLQEKKRAQAKLREAEEKNKELTAQLTRLKQSLEAVKEMNTRLRQEIEEKRGENKKLFQQIKEIEENKRKLSPPFPFGRRI